MNLAEAEMETLSVEGAKEIFFLVMKLGWKFSSFDKSDQERAKCVLMSAGVHIGPAGASMTFIVC